MKRTKELLIKDELTKLVKKIELVELNRDISSEERVIKKTLRSLISDYEDVASKIEETNQQVNFKSRLVKYARPSFLYVIYAMILLSIPFSLILSFFDQNYSENIIQNLTGWLGAIPDELWKLFMFAYLGYAGARSIDKFTLKKFNQKRE